MCRRPLCGSAAGHDGGTSDEQMDERATYVCVGRSFLSGTEAQNSGIGVIKGTIGQRRTMGGNVGDRGRGKNSGVGDAARLTSSSGKSATLTLIDASWK